MKHEKTKVGILGNLLDDYEKEKDSMKMMNCIPLLESENQNKKRY